MHELSYVMSLAKQAANAAEQNHAAKVEAVSVSIGEMAGLVPEYMVRYWTSAVKNTVLDGSELRVTLVPVEIRCAQCGDTYHPSAENEYLCPRCRTARGRLLHGREFMIDSITVDDEEDPESPEDP